MNPPMVKGFVAIDPDVGPDEPSSFDYQIEHLALKAQESIGKDLVVQAKDDFFVKTGKFHPEDLFYHARITYFLDTLLFEKTLALDYQRQFGNRSFFEQSADGPTEDSAFAVVRARHSLFQIDKIRQDRLLIQDLFAKEPIVVSQRPNQSFEGLGRKQIFQGFLYFTSTACYLSKGIFFHPDKVIGPLRKYVKKQLKGETFNEKEILFHLARLHMRHLRHPHVDARHIYADPRK